MISFNVMAPHEMQQKVAQQARALRLERNLSQKTLAEKSGVSYGSLKQFEKNGQISLASLLKLAVALDCMDDFNRLFAPIDSVQAITLDALIKDEKRKRGRK